MNSIDRIKITFLHKEPDRIPIGELSFNNKVASEILGRKVLVSSSGETRKEALLAFMRGPDFLKELVEKIIEDFLELAKNVELDFVYFRFTDYIFEVFSAQFIGSNGIFNVKIRELGENKWKLYTKDNFWSVYQYNKKSDMFYCLDNSIKNKGIKEFKRYISFLERNEDEISKNNMIYKIASFTKIALEKSKILNIPVFGHIDANFPLFEPHITFFLENMLSNPKIIKRYMKTTTKGLVNLLQEQLKLGITGVVATNDFAFKTGPIISPKLFRKFLLPCYKELVSICHENNKLFIKHLDGNVSNFMDMLVYEAKIDGAQAIEAQAGMDIKYIKEKYGKLITLIGNIDCSGVLQYGKEKEIVEAVLYLIQNVAKKGGYIFGSSNSIHKGIPTKNYLVAINALKKYGTYKN